ncbi:hypothetical protein SAMN02746095_01098 [Acidocella aminolytica 101 = DSM 11237]|nr:hypothetical protein SAMN02746095_01098 [Acidocella aminolytica 101 = DSM 11237]
MQMKLSALLTARKLGGESPAFVLKMQQGQNVIVSIELALLIFGIQG